jgi:hypothetical protein
MTSASAINVAFCTLVPIDVLDTRKIAYFHESEYPANAESWSRTDLGGQDL